MPNLFYASYIKNEKMADLNKKNVYQNTPLLVKMQTTDQQRLRLENMDLV